MRELVIITLVAIMMAAVTWAATADIRKLRNTQSYHQYEARHALQDGRLSRPPAMHGDDDPTMEWLAGLRTAATPPPPSDWLVQRLEEHRIWAARLAVSFALNMSAG